MEMIANITQQELTRVQSNGEVESKIKLRKPSHTNLLENVQNIPYMSTDNLAPEKPQASQEPERKVSLENFSEIPEKSDTIDFSEYVVKLNNATQLINNAKEEAALAQENAITSDGEVSRLSVEVSELEKQELDIETRNNELNQQLVEAYNHQSQILELIRKEQERIIQEANTRKRENEEKVAQFQNKIHDIRERITTKNEDIARKQEILRTLQQTEFTDINNLIDFSTQEDEEQVKKLA